MSILSSRGLPTFFLLGHIITDGLAVILAGIFAWGLRGLDFIEELRPVIYFNELQFSGWISLVILYSICWVFVFAIVGLYNHPWRFSIGVLFQKILIGSLGGGALLLAWFFWQREMFNSRFLILAWVVCTFLVVFLTHLLMRVYMQYLMKRGYGTHSLVIIGNESEVTYVRESIMKNPQWGWRIAKILSPQEIFKNTEFQWETVEALLLLTSERTPALEERAGELADAFQLELLIGAGSLSARAENMHADSIAGIPLIRCSITPLSGWGMIIKRIFDIVVSLLALPFFFIIMIPCAIAIRLDSPGPIFVALPRVGLRGKIFLMYKFRSMVENAPEMKEELRNNNERSDGPLFKMSRDPRITKVGMWLRSWSIDELPQIINVLRGEMSLVGPRPHEPSEIAQYLLRQKKVLAVRPGITGLAQINGRSSLPFVEEIKFDSWYVQAWSLWLDITIIAQTLPVLLRRQNAV